MELEIRTKEGTLIGKIKGKSALYQYQKIIESQCFDVERKSLKPSVTASDKEYKPYLLMTCKVDSILTYGEMEIWFAKGDYLKIL
jgi:hypothetical protein